MNHEILFRGKRIDNKEWVDGYYCPKPYSHFPCEDTIFPIETLNQCWQGVKIIPGTLSQYTGLTDKNGRKIFEGDILEAESGNRGYVVFINGAFMKSCNSKDMPFLIASDVNAVIGNVFDNPELIE